MQVVVWNMQKNRRNWKVLADLDPDIALLCEAPPPGPTSRPPLGDWRTRGLDCPHPDERTCNCRPWSTAIASRNQVDRIGNARRSRGGRTLHYGPSRQGSWIAGSVKDFRGFGTITAISLYGLLDERSDASVHRSLSEMAPIFDHRIFGRHLLLGGDLNILANARRDDPVRGRHLVVLNRIRAYGLIDCLDERFSERTGSESAVWKCPCGLGGDCRHSWTHRHGLSDIPYQDDYLFASRALADCLVSCSVQPFNEDSTSDHAQILATFDPNHLAGKPSSRSPRAGRAEATARPTSKRAQSARSFGGSRFNRKGLARAGFEGFVTVRDLRAGRFAEVPNGPGVYIVLLRDRWPKGTQLVYIGKGDRLRARLKQFIDFGSGRPVGHWGGRYTWQIKGSDDFVVAWKRTPSEDPRAVEVRLLAAFRAENAGMPPVANIAR